MPGYIKKARLKFQHKMTIESVDPPHKHTPIVYRAKQQPIQTNSSKKLSEDEVKRVQNIFGTLLYYSRCVDSTLAAALSSIASEQANGTEYTRAACHQLLDYVACHDNWTLKYIASAMILAVHSDASYLSEKQAWSQAGGHFHLTNHADKTCNNEAMLTIYSIIKHIMASSSEAELAAMFYNSREAITLNIALEQVGHRQPPTNVTVGNSMAHGLTQGTMIPKNPNKWRCVSIL